MSVGAKRIAAQAEIRLISSFCSKLASVSRLVSSFWRLVHERRVDRQDVREVLAEAVDALGDRRRVVGHVAQVALELLVGAVLLEAGDEAVEHREQRPRRALELDHLARELVDAPRHSGSPRKTWVSISSMSFSSPATTGA